MKKKKSLLSELFVFSGKYKYLTIVGMILSGVSAVLMLMPIIFVWMAVRDVFSVLPNVSLAVNAPKYGWFAVLFAVLGLVVYFVALMSTHICAFRTAKNMRIKALKHLITLPLGYFNSNSSGKLRRIIDDSAGQTENYMAHQLPDRVGAFVQPIAAVILFFMFDWRLGIVSLIPILISIIFLSQMTGPSLKNSLKEYQTALEDMNSEAVEYVRGMPVVKTFSQSIFSFKRFHESILRYKKWTVNYAIKLRILNTGYVTSLNANSLFLAVGAIFMITTVINYKAFLLDLLFYIFFIPICVTMMNKIMWTSENAMLANDALNRIKSVLKEEPLKETGKNIIPKKYDIEFKNVTFTYKGVSKPAVKNVSFTVKQGETIALVGPSGGGKTTTASLIPRFWDVDRGCISIGGINVKDISSKNLMNIISFVFQNSKLYKTSLLENIREGKENATQEEIINAVKSSQSEDIVNKFKDGLNTNIGSKGVYLSGGEMQRIALARAVLKDAPIVLLDEATAFADPENEYKIQKAFKKLTKGKTVIMIAHRLSTIKNADKIIVLDEGKIKESGTHAELIHQNRIYKNMWDKYQKSVSWKIRKEAIINE